MTNEIKRSYAAVISQVAGAISGMEQYAVLLNLSLVTPLTMNAKLAEVIAGETSVREAKAELRTRQLAYKVAKKAARDYLFAARDVLKNQLGKQYSSAWDETGFLHTLEVPDQEAKVATGVLGLNSFFTTHPGLENAPLNVTAARATVVRDGLIAARNAINSQKTAVKLAMAARDLKLAQVREQLRALLAELGFRLTPLDERWPAFGFNMPGQLVKPPTPENVTVTLIGANAISVKWDAAARAEHYRVFKKVVGVDDDYVQVGSPADLDFTIEGLPANATVEVIISAVNNGGESLRTTKVVVQTA